MREKLALFLSDVKLDRLTMEEACRDYCGRYKDCMFYKFNQDDCPKIQQVKVGLLLSALSG